MANERARTLRKNQTDAERMLWRALRAKQVQGCRFRRQHSIGPYIADFICLERKLIVELDGGQHGLPGEAARDAPRDAWLQERGYHVARFWNEDVYKNLNGVLLAVSELLLTGRQFEG